MLKQKYTAIWLVVFGGRARPWRWLCWLFLLPVTAHSAEPTHTNGQEVYKEYCSACHGDNGDGMTRVRRGLNPPPRDFTTRVAKAELSRERMVTSVTHGRPGTAMMPFSERLDEVQIGAVVDYVRDTFMLGEAVDVDDAAIRLARGKEIYVSNCAVCHGDDGNGAMWTKTSLNPAPRDFTTQMATDELSRERMISSVTHGRPGTAMMSFAKRLGSDEIASVVDYVRDEFLGRTSAVRGQTAQRIPPAHPTRDHSAPKPEKIVDADMSLAFPNNLVGDKVKGREFYMSNCFTCHGKKGDGQGPRAHFNRPAPRDFLASEARRTLNRPALFKSIGLGKVGTVMPAWSKVLSDQQIADVAEFVFQTFITAEVAPTERQSSQVSPEKKKAKIVASR